MITRLFILILIQVCAIFGIVTPSKGPLNYDTFNERQLFVGNHDFDCLSHIIKHHLYPVYLKQHDMYQVVTVFVSDDLPSTAYEVQEKILQKMFGICNKTELEIISKNQEIKKDYQGIQYKTSFYLLIIKAYDELPQIIRILKDKSSFNSRANFLVYLSEASDQIYQATRILETLNRNLILYCGVFISDDSAGSNFYQMNHITEAPNACLSNHSVYVLDSCENGKMKNILHKYFYTGLKFDFYGCTIGVFAMPYEPFVIDDQKGFEIEVLKDIGRSLNLSFNIVMGNFSEGWGKKTENNTWTGGFKYIYDDMYIGIGNIDTGMEGTDAAFSFSYFYHMEPLVFVVPIAKYLPHWQVIVAIFTVEMWGIILAIIVGFAIVFYFSSKYTKDIIDFKNNSLLSSYQIIVSHPVPRQPNHGLTRIFFLSLSIFSILIYSSYTCSLLVYLKNPIREKQPSTFSDLEDEFGNIDYRIGGITRYKKLFNNTENTLFDLYETVNGTNNTIIYWLRKVAEERNIWTISSSFYANYLLSENIQGITDNEGKPKIYIFKEQIISYSVSMLFRKGHPLYNKFERIIKQFLYGGLVNRICNKYVYKIQEDQSEDIGGDTTLEELDIEHMQGAFAMLILGYTAGFIVFIVEIVMGRRQMKKNKKFVNKRRVKFQIFKKN